MASEFGAYSFDIFDTCLSRTFAHPRDLFHALSLQLVPSNSKPHQTARFAARFQQHRIQAEKAATRHAANPHTITLADIYTCFRPLPGLTLSATELVEAEIALERASLYPIPAMLKRIRALRSDGQHIIFISDMYLPARVLGPILIDLGVMEPDDGLYVSCDAGCSKHDGSLFDHVLRIEGIDASQLVHHGDNLHADVHMARSRGIAAHHVADGNLTAREWSVAGRYRRRQLPRPVADSFLAGFSRRLRLAAPHPTKPLPYPLEGLLCDTVIPLLLAYVTWLLDDASELGVRRLYFVARDGYVLERMARELEAPEQGVETRYLYGSRRAWLLPSWPWDDEACDRAVLIPGKPCTPRIILQRLNLDAGQQHHVLNALGLVHGQADLPLTRISSKNFLQKLRQDSAAAGTLRQAADVARELTLNYLNQEGLFDGTSWALADSGWSLNAQAALGRILQGSAPHQTVRGFYLALVRNHLSERLAGPTHAFAMPTGRLLSSRTHLMDHCVFPTPHATTRAYARHGEQVLPVFDEDARLPQELAYAKRLQVLAQTAAGIARNDACLRTNLRVHAEAIMSHAERFIAAPDRETARALSRFNAYTDVRQERRLSEVLCQPLGMGDVLAIAKRGLFGTGTYSTPVQRWMEGSVALSPTWIRWPMRLAIMAAHSRRPHKPL